MRFMSFNTQHCFNYITKEIDFKAMADAILSLGADIVGLNEIRGAGEDSDYTAQTERLAALTGMPYFYFAKALDVDGKNPYGNAILSKIPLKEAQTLIIPLPPKEEDSYYEQRCVLKAKTKDGLTLLITHFGLSSKEQENAVKTILSLLNEKRCVLMGDFNLSPDSPLLLPLLEKMSDTAALFPSPLFSFPSDEPHIKIDYILHTPDLTCSFADIPAIVVSDHRPYIADIM